MIYTQHILHRQGLKIKLVGSIVIRGHRLGVTVYDDGLKAQLLKSHGSMYAAVVKLDTLADTVGTAAQDHDLFGILIYGILILSVICGEIISAVLGA